MGKRYNWLEIRAAYVEGLDGEGGRLWPSLAQLAERFGAGERTVERRCRREGWAQQRARFQARIEVMTREHKAIELARKAAQLDERCLELAEALLALIRRALVELDRAMREQKIRDSSRLLAALGLAMLRSQQVAKLAVGEAADITRHELPRGEFRLSGGFEAEGDVTP